MRTLILLRHGQSTWNEANLFTGWTDVPLTTKGTAEAREAGRLIKNAGYPIEMAFTSVLRRAIKTLWLALEEMDRMWIPVEQSWRLNERHYGNLQGADKIKNGRKVRTGTGPDLEAQLRRSSTGTQTRRRTQPRA